MLDIKNQQEYDIIFAWLQPHAAELYDADLDDKRLDEQLTDAIENNNIAAVIEIADELLLNNVTGAKEYSNRLLRVLLAGVSLDEFDFKTDLHFYELFADKDRIGDHQVAKFGYSNPLLKKASSVDELISAAQSCIDYLKDKDIAKPYLEKAITIASMFTEYQSIAEAIATVDYMDDKVWAKDVFQKAVDMNIASSDFISLCESIANDYYLGDKVWAKELIKQHIAFEDQVNYKEIIDLASMDDLLCDEEFSNKIFESAKEQCSSFDEAIELLNQLDNGSDITKSMMLSLFYDIILILKNNQQKDKLIEAIEYSLDEDYVGSIKTTSIEEFKKLMELDESDSDLYHIISTNVNEDGLNSFDDDLELKLPTLDEMLDLNPNEPQHSEIEIIKWLGELTMSVLTFDNPINEYNNGNYDECLRIVENLMKDSSLDKEYNAKYYNDLKKQISMNEDETEELTLDIPTIDEVIPAQISPNNNDLKQQYSQKIASGEICPTEVSFADFEAMSQNKEIDYKAVYSQMISEEKIDPTETSYDEMIKVSKLFGGVEESEFKATYSKYIASGEIDPSETTYDEIVNIANIFNELNDNENSTVTMDDIYDYLMNNVNDDNDYLVDEFLQLKEGSGDSFDFATLAGNMLDIDLNEPNMIKYLLDKSYELSEDYENLKYLANVIMDYDTPPDWQEWAKELYKESESQLETVDGILDLAHSISNHVDSLVDYDWVLNLYERAVKESQNFEDMLNTADAVAGFDEDANREWAKKIYQKAENLAEGFEEYKKITDNVSHDMFIGDKEYGKELFEISKQKATNADELADLIELLVSDDNFDDIDSAKQMCYKTLPRCSDFDDFLRLIYATSLNKELQKEMILESIKVMNADEEKEKLYSEVEYDLDEDKEFLHDIELLSVQELKAKYLMPSTEELKKLYAAGIGNGTIDPVEVSFDSFEKNYGANTSSSSSNEDYNQLLIEAAENNDVSLAQKCLDNGADIDYQTNDGSRTGMWTPLLYAAWDGHLEVGKLLVDNGANLKAEDRKGYKANDLAAADCGYGNVGNQELSDYIWSQYVEQYGAWG